MMGAMEASSARGRLAQVDGEELRQAVAGCARGDAQALRLLYDRLSPMAMALALRILGSRGEAEEILQEAFLEVWRRAREYDPRRGAPGAWVTTIVRSRALDRVRARASATRTAVASAEQVIVPPAPSPLEDTERRVERERIVAALAALPSEQRGAIELAYYEGLSHSEIAARTGTPLGTVKTRIKLAVDKLAQLLGVRARTVQ